MVGQRKNVLISSTSKTPILSFWGYISSIKEILGGKAQAPSG